MALWLWERGLLHFVLNLHNFYGKLNHNSYEYGFYTWPWTNILQFWLNHTYNINGYLMWRYLGVSAHGCGESAHYLGCPGNIQWHRQTWCHVHNLQSPEINFCQICQNCYTVHNFLTCYFYRLNLPFSFSLSVLFVLLSCLTGSWQWSLFLLIFVISWYYS